MVYLRRWIIYLRSNTFLNHINPYDVLLNKSTHPKIQSKATIPKTYRTTKEVLEDSYSR